jgi:3-oxoacyl-[acyl-carrier-protein] synthase II
VITGIGIVSPVGIGTEESFAGLLAAKSGIGKISLFDASGYPVRIAGEVPGFEPERWFSSKDARKLDRYEQFAVVAAREAMADAGLDRDSLDGDRTGVLIGSGLGGLESLQAAADVIREKGPQRVSPFTIPKIIANLAAGLVSIEFGARGPNLACVSACATGAHSLGDAARLIAMGDADAMIAGGAEATIGPICLASFAAMKALSSRNDEPERASRPFDRERDGFVAAEGAAVLVLELYEKARARGARIYAELSGYGQSADAHHITSPDPDGRGAALAMQHALDDAQLAPGDVQYLNAHGTSTPYNDAIETRAIKTVFGPHASQLWISSTKSCTGHMLGAAGAFEAAVTALAIHRGQVPPTANLETPDPECDLDYVPGKSRKREISAALSNSFGFGGTNVCLALRALPEAGR